jgi:hypothetical protein
VTRIVDPGGRRRSQPSAAPRRVGDAGAIARLQRSAGNRAVGRLLARSPGIAVPKGSKFDAQEFVNVLKRNRKVPDWLKSHVSGKDGAISLSGKLEPPSGRIWEFDEPFAKAFASGSWEITTARSTIEATKDKDGKVSLEQLVTPDLAKGERLGHWMKIGHDELDFSNDPLRSDLSEVIYGWTVPDTATPLDKKKRNIIVIVREIEVTAPDGRKRTFKPDADNIAEAILHEISVHAGRISMGLPDAHDGSAVVKDVTDQVGGFFRTTGASGDLEPSDTTKAILKFVGAK